MVTRHVIFDCDGVLVDSEPLSMRADVTLLRRYGIEMSEAEAHRRFVGATFQAMLDMMSAQYGTKFPHGLSAEKDAILERMYQTDLKMSNGLTSALQTLRARNISFSVASNSPKKRVELALRLTGLTPLFDRIVTFEDVLRGKPAPDVFLKARDDSGFSTDQCCVVEDSTTGVQAAVAAGLRTIGYVGTHNEPVEQAQKLKALGAAAILHEMAQLPEFV